MTLRRVCIVVSARASYSRVRTALLEIQAHPALDLHVVAVASALLDRYGGALHLMEEDGLQVAARASTVLDGHDPTTMATSTGLALLKLVTILENLRPDVVVTIADRYETLATATAAAYMNIPLVHLQGGEVTGSVDEKVRHAVTKLANLHLVSTPQAAQRVIAMGEDPRSVFVTGCPSIDLAVEASSRSDVAALEIIDDNGHPCHLDLSGDYVVVLQHPVTTEYTSSRWQILETLHAVRASGLPAVVCRPNEDAGSEGINSGIHAFRTDCGVDRFVYLDSLRPVIFLQLLKGSRCLLGNSSVGIRECSFMGVPVVNVGSRQSNRERGANVLDVPHDRKAIVEALRHQLESEPYASNTLYGTGCAGEKIAAILAEAPLNIEKHYVD